jgi:endonuclease/exonuclease/phosphatase (EEP) superfamily protein YafD
MFFVLLHVCIFAPMNLDFLDHARVRQILSLLLLIGAMLSIFPPDSYTIKWWSSRAELISLAYLGIGLLFLVFNKSRLMFVSLGCSAAIAFFINETTNSKIIDVKPTDMPFIKIAHFNVVNSEGQVDDFINTIISAEADILSLQEITPDWDEILKESLNNYYPYSSSISRLDPNGLAIYSKYPFKQLDTFYFKDLPNIMATVRPDGFDKDVAIIGSVLKPPLSGSAFEDMKNHLEKISFHVNILKIPVVTIGNYNTVPWSPEIQEFREASSLKDARRGIKPSVPDGQFPLFNALVDHIFYTEDFECTNFITISNAYTNQAGIEAVLQQKKPVNQ